MAEPTADPMVAARRRVEGSLHHNFTWSTWQNDLDREAKQALAHTDRVMTDPKLLAMSRQALANDGHCAVNAPQAAVAALTFEQIYLSRVTTLVQTRGSFWGGKDAVPAASCRWSRAAGVLTAEHAAKLAMHGLVVVDDVLTAAEVDAARADIESLDARGELKEVTSQAKARLRNDRVGWLSAASASVMPALGVAIRLLRAIPAEVERQIGWQLSVPQTLMAAVYPGSPSQPAAYCKHFDGGGPGNPRQLTAILYLNRPWEPGSDGGALRAYWPLAAGFCDIVPQGGRLLLFNSRTIEHEVMNAFRPRYAITLWASGDDGTCSANVKRGRNPTT